MQFQIGPRSDFHSALVWLNLYSEVVVVQTTCRLFLRKLSSINKRDPSPVSCRHERNRFLQLFPPGTMRKSRCITLVNSSGIESQTSEVHVSPLSDEKKITQGQLSEALFLGTVGSNSYVLERKSNFCSHSSCFPHRFDQQMENLFGWESFTGQQQVKA